MSTHGYLADKPGRSCVVLPICASKYGCLVNQNGGENLEVENNWLRTHGEFEAISPERRHRRVITVYKRQECGLYPSQDPSQEGSHEAARTVSARACAVGRLRAVNR